MAISPDAFAKKMMAALRRAGVSDELRYDAERFSITRAGGGELFLTTAHQVYTEAPFWRRGGTLKVYAHQMASFASFKYPETFDAARANLVPVVRNGVYLDVAELLRTRRDDRAATPSR